MSRASVYLMTDGTYYKIGMSTNVEQRRKQLNTGNPHKIKTVCVVNGKGHFLENKLHNKFSSKRVEGEWFNLGRRDVMYIKNLSKRKSYTPSYELDSSSSVQKVPEIQKVPNEIMDIKVRFKAEEITCDEARKELEELGVESRECTNYIARWKRGSYYSIHDHPHPTWLCKLFIYVLGFLWLIYIGLLS